MQVTVGVEAAISAQAADKTPEVGVSVQVVDLTEVGGSVQVDNITGNGCICASS